MKQISEEDILLMGWSEEDFKRFKDCRCAELTKENEELKERNNNTFNQGYVLAVAELIRQHDRQVEARDILKGLGKVDWSKISEYDKEPLKKAHLI